MKNNNNRTEKKEGELKRGNTINQPAERDAWDMFIDIWTSKLGILIGSIFVLSVLGIVGMWAGGYISIGWTIGQTEIIIALSLLASVSLGGWFIVLPMLSLSSQDFELLIKINSTHDSILDAWIMHPTQMQKVEVSEGTATQTVINGISVYIVREYDPKNKNAVGTWRGEMSDVELETHRQAMEMNRGRLRTWAQIGQQLYAKIPALAISIENSIHQASTDRKMKSESGPRFSDSVSSEVYDSIEKLTDSIETPDEKSPEEIADEVVSESVDTGDVSN